MYEKTYRRLLLCLLSLIICLIYGSLKLEDRKSDTNTFVDVEEEQLSPSLAMNKEQKFYVYPSGEPIGIYVKTDGVMVIDVTSVKGVNGENISPCDGKIMQGDYIMAIDGQNISSKREMIKQVQQSAGNQIVITLRRGNSEFTERVKPVMGSNQKYLIGLWVKDDISGIGTMTYETQDEFGALGHSINDNDTGELFHISDGAVYKAEILNIRKPIDGVPGRLEGVINYASENMVGRVQGNKEYGIKGQLVDAGRKDEKEQNGYVEIASRDEIHLGNAYLVSALTGQRKSYEVQVVSLDFERNDTKAIELKVEDEQLLELTGGIVQGMSGTPILQDGKLIGAVTHVFVNDPTKGYGIYIGDMIEDKIH